MAVPISLQSGPESGQASGTSPRVSQQTASRVAVKQNHNSLALPDSDKFKSIKTVADRPFVRRHSHDFVRNAPGPATAVSLNQRINQFGLFECANQQVDLNTGHPTEELRESLRNQSDRPSNVQRNQNNHRRGDESLRIAGRTQCAETGDRSSPFAANRFVRSRVVNNFQRSVSDLSNAILRKSLVLENRSISQHNEPRHPLKLNLKNFEQKLDTSFSQTSGEFFLCFCAGRQIKFLNRRWAHGIG